MISRRAKFIRWMTSLYLRRLNPHTADVVAVRRRVESFSRLLRAAEGVEIEETRVHGLHAEWLRPRAAADDRTLLYLHGGAYVLGSCLTHRAMVSYIARSAGIRALVPEYRLAPEHPFPAAIEDAVGVYRDLLAGGTRPLDIVIAGDSAGGGLAVATMLALRDAGDPLPGAAVLLSPFLDVTASGVSATTRAARDPWFRVADICVVRDNYCQPGQVTDPGVSPLFADVSGLPNTLVQVGYDEILLSDSTRFADKMRAAGGFVELEVWPDMWHVFQLFVGKMPEAHQAIDRIANFIQKQSRPGLAS